MFANNVSTELIVLCVILAGFIALLGYLLPVALKRRRTKLAVNAISAALIDYFRRTGVEVSVICADLHGTNRFTAFIESEPMKRFRLSHIIESTLREHVEKTCGLTLDKVYWRFPIRETSPQSSDPQKSIDPSESLQGTDDYINEGLVHSRDLPKFEVTEIPWEKFEEATSGIHIPQEPETPPPPERQ